MCYLGVQPGGAGTDADAAGKAFGAGGTSRGTGTPQLRKQAAEAYWNVTISAGASDARSKVVEVVWNDCS